MNNFKWSKSSRERLDTCSVKLIELMNTALKTSPYDITIGCGYRDKSQQNMAYLQGYSKAKWGQSKHNIFPSQAVDVYPYHNGRMVNGSQEGDKEIIKELARHILRVARDLDIQILWGGHFNSFEDLPHFELIK